MRLVAGRFALSHLHGAALCFKLMTTNTNDRWVDALSQHMRLIAGRCIAANSRSHMNANFRCTDSTVTILTYALAR